MDECIDHLLFLQQSTEEQYIAKIKRVGLRFNQNYDEEMSMLAKLATHHACKLVEEQYRVSGQETYETSNDVNEPGLWSLSSAKTGGQYAVNLKENSCSRAFYHTVLLPCRHMLFLRRNSSDLRSFFSYESIPAWWLLADKGEEPPSVLETIQKLYIEDIETPARPQREVPV
ncbi:hypothetical protein PI124_g19612 [Phytophthora idaei]|nr:hypothetical protein PI126_g19098 [Phytophthora idaei]KAG3235351.1 hypothetical protein PI124_g19612 [Phytophthora idaei]